jgi:prepilin-type N-terminal cleavage/methylation domain-containing protein
MSIKPEPKLRQAYTLVEVMVATAVFSISALALSSIFLFSIKSFAGMANYASLDRENRFAMDTITRELRQARQVTSYTCTGQSNSITFLNGDGANVTYAFDALAKQFIRDVDGSRNVLLTNCNLLNFRLYQRNPSNGVFGIFPVASNNWQRTVKVLQLTWKTGRTLPSGIANSENIQTALIVIRKQQD